MRITYCALSLALMLPAAAGAQRLEPVGVRPDGATASQAQGARAATRVDASQLSIRALLGVGSAFAGAFGGALAASAGPISDCNCDDPGLREAIWGGMVGAIIVPALVASIPSMNSECSFARRAGIGMIGGVVGAAFGGVAGAIVDRGGAGVPIGYVGGAGLGAALGSGLCR